MKSRYKECNDILCPFLNKCVLAEENPGKPFPCALDDVDWQVAASIYMDYHIKKAYDAVRATGLEMNDDDKYMSNEYADCFEEMLEKVMYVNPD